MLPAPIAPTPGTGVAVFNYRDLPETEWDGMRSAEALVTLIRSNRAFILSLPETSRLHIDPEACDCAVDSDSGAFYNCNAGITLAAIAENNELNGFEPLIDATAETGARADIDAGQRRVVIHW